MSTTDRPTLGKARFEALKAELAKKKLREATEEEQLEDYGPWIAGLRESNADI